MGAVEGRAGCGRGFQHVVRPSMNTTTRVVVDCINNGNFEGGIKVAVLVALVQPRQVAGRAPAAQAQRGAAGSSAANADASNDQVIAAFERRGASTRPLSTRVTSWRPSFCSFNAGNELEFLQLAAANKDDTQQAALRAAVIAMETGAFDADITMLLHHAGEARHTPTGAGIASAPAVRVWRVMNKVMPRLLHAPTRYYAKLCPHGMDAGAAVKAICQGKLTVETLAGAALVNKMSAPETRNAVIRAWPVMLAMMREIMPRDTTAEHHLLLMVKDAFDASRSMVDQLATVVTPVFGEMTLRYGDFLRAGTLETTWEKVRTDITAESMRFAALSTMYNSGAAAGAAAVAAAAKAAQAQKYRLVQQAATAAAQGRVATAALALANKDGAASSFNGAMPLPAQ